MDFTLLMVMSSNAFHVYRVVLPSSRREEEDRVQTLKKKCLLSQWQCIKIGVFLKIKIFLIKKKKNAKQ